MLERGTHGCGAAYGRRHGRDRRGGPSIRCLRTAAASAQDLVRHWAEQEHLSMRSSQAVSIPDASVMPMWRKSTHSGGESGDCLEVNARSLN